MPVIECVQGTNEWRDARLGVATASCFDKIITPKGEASKSQTAYMYKLICEMIYRETAAPELIDIYQREEDMMSNQFWIRRGRDLEELAAEDFAQRYNVALDKVGFIVRQDGRAGCSPDRIIAGRNECVEIKCPSPWQHLQYAVEGPGTDYRQQAQGQMLIGNFDCVHFYSFFPGWPCVSHVVERDPVFIGMLERELNQFLKRMDKAIDQLREMGTFRRRPETGTVPLQPSQLRMQ